MCTFIVLQIIRHCWCCWCFIKVWFAKFGLQFSHLWLLSKMYSNVFWHGSCICLFLTFIWNVFECVPAWRLLCSDLPIPGCCSCVLPPGGRVTSRHGRPSRFNPPFQNFDKSHLFWPFSEAFFSWKTSSGPKLWSLLKKGRAENVGRGRAVRFKLAFQN